MIFAMKQKKFLLGFLLGLFIGLVMMAVYASYRFITVAEDLRLLKDMNQGKLRQIERLEAAINQRESQLEKLLPPILSEEEKSSYLLTTKKIAADFTSFNEKENGKLIEYRNEELGFKMSYPAAWGIVTMEIETPETDPGFVLNGKFLRGEFEHGHAYFSAKSADYKDLGHGLSSAESILQYTGHSGSGDPLRELPNSDEKRVLGNNQHIFTWYAWPVGWETGDTVMAFEAPLGHPDLRAIAFVGPVSNGPLPAATIEGFLEMARTYELLK